MNTHFISHSEVRAYLRDLLRNLRGMNPRPAVWCPMTRSGTVLLREMRALMETEFQDLAQGFSVVTVDADDHGAVSFRGYESGDFEGKKVFLFDGAVHSGTKIQSCTRKLLSLGATDICTYSLVLKHSSKFIPTLWAVSIADTDRAYFLLDSIPNNRLDAGPHHDSPPYVHIRTLSENDLDMAPVVSGVASLDRVTWSDRNFDMQLDSERSTYLLESASVVVGYLTVNRSTPGVLQVDEIVVGQSSRGAGHGGILLRFAETLARQSDAHSVRLHAIEDRIQFYSKHGYHPVAGAKALRLDSEVYHLMERPVLYHLRPRNGGSPAQSRARPEA